MVHSNKIDINIRYSSYALFLFSFSANLLLSSFSSTPLYHSLARINLCDTIRGVFHAGVIRFRMGDIRASKENYRMQYTKCEWICFASSNVSFTQPSAEEGKKVDGKYEGKKGKNWMDEGNIPCHEQQQKRFDGETIRIHRKKGKKEFFIRLLGIYCNPRQAIVSFFLCECVVFISSVGLNDTQK